MALKKRLLTKECIDALSTIDPDFDAQLFKGRVQVNDISGVHATFCDQGCLLTHAARGFFRMAAAARPIRTSVIRPAIIQCNTNVCGRL